MHTFSLQFLVVTALMVSPILAVAENHVQDAIKTATKIASFSRPMVLLAKECTNRAYETTLAEGIRYERRMFHACFATEDQKEGMAAFAEKRKPAFKGR